LICHIVVLHLIVNSLAWPLSSASEMSLEVTSLAVQVHGRMGFIEETGVAQHYRDARILTIHERTTAIQANDLAGRETARDGGAAAKAVAQAVEGTIAQLRDLDDPAARSMARRLGEALQS
jgi:hypothetical protein